jgi:Rrf2 family iron-sulfur cluster assembly transcriptional regulator
MRISTSSSYAVRALVELAECEAATPGRPVRLAAIAGRRGLPEPALEQLFARLRRAGLVASNRGPGGGYRLAMPSDQISVAAIIAAVDEPIRVTRCESGSGPCLALPGQMSERCQTHDLWAELGRQITLFLDGMSLADIVLGHVSGRARSPADSINRLAAE